mmetsp:Transcript_31989/g.31377  ORF Transcript_31989/g.31377 Transcript_31989/m.31377 type:complete len:146 (-) Transcript_31989:155-592(-)
MVLMVLSNGSLLHMLCSVNNERKKSQFHMNPLSSKALSKNLDRIFHEFHKARERSILSSDSSENDDSLDRARNMSKFRKNKIKEEDNLSVSQESMAGTEVVPHQDKDKAPLKKKLSMNSSLQNTVTLRLGKQKGKDFLRQLIFLK